MRLGVSCTTTWTNCKSMSTNGCVLITKSARTPENIALAKHLCKHFPNRGQERTVCMWRSINNWIAFRTRPILGRNKWSPFDHAVCQIKSWLGQLSRLRKLDKITLVTVHPLVVIDSDAESLANRKSNFPPRVYRIARITVLWQFRCFHGFPIYKEFLP